MTVPMTEMSRAIRHVIENYSGGGSISGIPTDALSEFAQILAANAADLESELASRSGWTTAQITQLAQFSTLPNVQALGWLSAELARRADAGNGNAPDWFPEPPEWLALWEQAIAATAESPLS